MSLGVDIDSCGGASPGVPLVVAVAIVLVYRGVLGERMRLVQALKILGMDATVGTGRRVGWRGEDLETLRIFVGVAEVSNYFL